MKKSIRLNSNVVGDILRSRTGRHAAPQKSQGTLPDPSVAVVVDGKLIDSSERAGLHERTLHYTLAALNKGGLALVAFSDPAILDRQFLSYFEPRPNPNDPIEAALRSAGLDLERVFNERDDDKRRTAIDDLFVEQPVMYEPTNIVKGREAISRVAGDLLKQFGPAFRFVPEGAAVGHHGLAHLSWHADLKAAR